LDPGREVAVPASCLGLGDRCDDRGDGSRRLPLDVPYSGPETPAGAEAGIAWCPFSERIRV